MTTPFKALNPFTPRFIEIDYVAPDGGCCAMSSSSGSQQSLPDDDPPDLCGGPPEDLYTAVLPEEYVVSDLCGEIINQAPFPLWRYVMSESGRVISVGGNAPEFGGNARRYYLSKNGSGFDATEVAPGGNGQSMGGISRNYQVCGVNGFDNEGTPVATGGLLWPAGAFATSPTEDTVTCLYRDISPDGQWILGNPGSFSPPNAVVVKTQDLTFQTLLDQYGSNVSVNQEGGRRFTACSDRIICERSRFDLSDAGVWVDTTGGIVDGSVVYQGISGDGETIWINVAGAVGYLPNGNTQLGAAVMIGIPPGCIGVSYFCNAPDNSRIFVGALDGIGLVCYTWTLTGGWQLLTDYLTSVGAPSPAWITDTFACNWDGTAFVVGVSPGQGFSVDSVNAYYIP